MDQNELLQKALRRVEGRLRNALTSEWHEPYDEADLEELLTMYAGKNKTKLRKLKRKMYRYDPGIDYVRMVRYTAKLFRIRFGLKEPIEFNRIGDFIATRRWIAGDTTEFKVLLLNPVINIEEYGYRICVAESLKLAGKSKEDNENILEFKLGIDWMAILTGTHPAIALMIMLCDMPAIYDMFEIVQLRGGNNHNNDITINIRHPSVPTWLINQAYLALRNCSLRKTKIDQGQIKYFRWRDKSDKVTHLIDFVIANKRLSWPQRYNEWKKHCVEEGHPEWIYKSMVSMRVVYYRGKSKLARNLG